MQKAQKLNNFFKNHGNLLSLKKGRMLFGQDDPATKVFFLKKGAVKIYRYSADGKELMLDLLGNNQLITITPLLKATNHVAYAETLIDSEIYWVGSKEFSTFLNKETEVWKEVAEILAYKWDEVLDRSEAFETRNALGRVAYIIKELVEKYGIEEKNKLTLPFPLTHQDLANITGMFRETVSLTMQQLTKKKIISREKQTIRVENIRKLSEFANNVN